MSLASPRGGRYRKALAATVCVGSMVALSACSSGPERVAPPHKVGNDVVVGSVPAGFAGDSRDGRQLPAVLVGKTAYLASATDVRAVNTANGQTTDTIRPSRPALSTSTPVQGQPLLTNGGGATAVVWPFVVAAPNGAAAVELTTIHPDNHSASNALVALPGWAATPQSPPSVALIGTSGAAVVLALSHGLQHGALAADLTTGRVLWAQDYFTPSAVVSDVVVGSEPDAEPARTNHLAGRAVNTGQVRWTQLQGHDFAVSTAGPNLLVVDSLSPTSAGQHTVQLISDTGAVVRQLSLQSYGLSRCVYDQDATTVCTAPADPQADSTQAIGIDARTGKELWIMPNWDVPRNATDGGKSPLLTAAYHGTIYADIGTTAVTFSARNGAPDKFLPGASPLLVNDQMSLAVAADKMHIVARPPTPVYDYVPTKVMCTSCAPS